MDNNSLNYDVLHTFFKGWRGDFENHAESKESFIDGINGRLISNDGILSYSSILGTRKVYENTDIVKYLGWYAFKDELVLFTKCLKTTVIPDIECTESAVVSNFSGSVSSDTDTIFMETFFTDHTISETVETCVPVIPIDEDDFNQNVSCSDNEGSQEEDYRDLFINIPLVPLQYCPIYSEDAPLNNEDYLDGIWSMKFDSSGNLVSELVYIGNLNFPMNAKICCVGVDENAFRKPVYFTEFNNPFRVINLKDRKLRYRSPEEFSLNIEGTLLNPQVKEIRHNGSLKAMSVLYLYRLISDNGQISDFSPASTIARIYKGDEDYTFAGGRPAEVTDKSVLVHCIVPNFENFSEIQLIAVEYEAAGVPTTLRVVGRKEVNFYNEFEHFGSEPEFTENITLSSIFANSISWKYCSDMKIKNNKLVVVGTRNDPSYVNSKNVDVDFSLHGFDHSDGSTHGCLLNPDPVKYQYIDAQMSAPFLFVNRKLFRRIEAFGNFWVRLQNKITQEYYQLNIYDSTDLYTDHIQEIYEWLETLLLLPDFNVKFPNLSFIRNNGNVLFVPVDDSIETDMYNYNLIFSTPQVIIDFDNEIKKRTYSWPVTVSEKNQRLVYGGVSNGYFNGNGVRVTMKRTRDAVIDKNTDWPISSAPILKITKPTLLKCFMKGEIYRLGIQWYKNGNRLFTTILGDLKIPEIGQTYRELDIGGAVIFGGPAGDSSYKNWKVEGNTMYAERIELMFDIRIGCELSREVDAYQIVYVERTENNRTILAQGISAPLQRMNIFEARNDVVTNFDEKITNKWNLPYYGGPVYDGYGLENYDVNPNNEDVGNNLASGKNRIVTHRKLFYFDAPDLIHDRISSQSTENAYMDLIESVATDHDRFNIASGYNRLTSNNNNAYEMGSEINMPDGTFSRADVTAAFGAPKFSTKIPFNLLGASTEQKPFYVNTSVFATLFKRKQYGLNDFSNTLLDADFKAIDNTEQVLEGEVLSAFRMGEMFDISNNAAALGVQGWWWQLRSRYRQSAEQSSFRVNNILAGRKSLFVKTATEYFTNANIVQNSFEIKATRSFGTSDDNRLWATGRDAHFISNIRRKNQDSVYGGRTEYAYSTNEYIPLGETIPVIKNNVSSQITYVKGDSYCTLFIRNKTNYNQSKTPELVRFSYNDADKFQYQRYGAWNYAAVLETTVEPRLNYSDEFYRETSNIIFKMDEVLNSAYMQENDLRKSIPRPFKFKDDPNQTNMIAVSNPKISGDYYDGFTQFLTNEFYELDKDAGAALNIYKEKDTLFVVQELKTSQIQMDENQFITPDQGGKAIQIQQGDSSSISGHQVVSEYGTSIRRAIIGTPEFGFSFFDERKKEFVKIIEGLFQQNELSLKMNALFSANKIIDTEPYYDPKYKETNIRIRTETGLNFVISYNEMLKVFNGKFDLNYDIHPLFQEKLIVPYANSSKLGIIGEGNVLEFSELPKKNMFLEIITAEDAPRTKIEKGAALHLNLNYPIKKAIFETSLGQIKEILGTHHWYKIREGVHTFPSKNMMDTTDIRGEWIKTRIEIESLDNKEIHLFSMVNYLRNSTK